MYGKKIINQTFSSLKIRNYRLYFTSQIISSIGTWMQVIGQSWLVLNLTNSGTALGFTVALQFLPILILGPWGGVIVDNFPKRKLLYFTQSFAGILALSLALLVITNAVQVWMIYCLALCLGLVNALDGPARQTFIYEMVGKDSLMNAISLNSVQTNLSRLVGPMIAAILLAAFGLAPLFFFNAFSYIAVLIALSMMNMQKIQAQPTIAKISAQLIEGLRYIRTAPIIRTTLLMMFIIGTFTYEFSISLPLLAKFTFNGTATAYALLTSAIGIGSLLGAIKAAHRKRVRLSLLVRTAFLFGASVLLFAAAPTITVALFIAILIGFFSITFLTLGNVILQTESLPHMRGRVMSLWIAAFLGTTAIGGPIIGFVGETLSPRWSLMVGGIAAIIAATIGLGLLKFQIKNITT
jgi:MFS family permease